MNKKHYKIDIHTPFGRPSFEAVMAELRFLLGERADSEVLKRCAYYVLDILKSGKKPKQTEYDRLMIKLRMSSFLVKRHYKKTRREDDGLLSTKKFLEEKGWNDELGYAREILRFAGFKFIDAKDAKDGKGGWLMTKRKK